MFDQLLNMAKEQVGSLLDNNNEVNSENRDQVGAVAGESVISALMGQVQNGNLGGISEMLSGKDTDPDHPAAAGLMPDVISNLTTRLGISSEAAANIARTAVPAIMNMLNSKVQEKGGAGGLDIGSLIGNLGGGGGIGDMIQGFLGGKEGEAGKDQNTDGGSDIGGMLKNLFG